MESEKGTICVIMAAYNAEAHLREAVDSVLVQTYRNLVLLVSDDASTDHTWEILTQYAHKDPRVRLLRNEHNLSFSGNRNKLFNAIPESSDFVAILDSDDVAEPTRLEEQHKYLSEHQEIAAVGCDLKIIDESSQIVATRCYPHSATDVLASALSSNPVANSSLMLRKRIIDETGLYDESLGCCEDYEYLLRILERHAVSNLPSQLVRYRISDTQWSNRKVRHMLAMTQKVQRRFMFRKRFFNIRGFVSHMLKYILFLLPPTLIQALFRKITFRQ